jgi:hypothetical protein
MLDYCWQCGIQLTNVSNAGQFYQGAQPTREYSLPHVAPPFNNYGQNYRQNNGQNYGQNFGQNYAPNYQPRPSSVSYGRIAAVLGGIFVAFLLFSGAVGFVVYGVFLRPAPPRYEPYRYRNPEPPKPVTVKENPVTNDRRSDQPSAKLEKLWVDYNVRENGRLGMRIHAKFSVYDLKGVDSQLAIYFEKADGTKLKSTARKFSSKDGQVAVFRALKPGFDDTVYSDLDVFMPYDELKLGRGKYDLKMDVDVIYESGEMIEHLGYHDFQYEKD